MGSSHRKRLKAASERFKAQALQAFAARAYERALDAYERLTEAEPWELRHWLRVGDCLARLGRDEEAVAAYRGVAKQYAARGRRSEAAGVYRMVVEVDPFDADAHAALMRLESRPRVSGATRETAPEIRWTSDALTEQPHPELPNWTERVSLAVESLLHSDASGAAAPPRWFRFLNDE